MNHETSIKPSCRWPLAYKFLSVLLLATGMLLAATMPLKASDIVTADNQSAMKEVLEADPKTQSQMLFQALNHIDPHVRLAAAKKLSGKSDIAEVSEFVKQFNRHEALRFGGGIDIHIAQSQFLKQLVLNMAKALKIPEDQKVPQRDSKVLVPGPTEWDRMIVEKATELIQGRTKLNQKTGASTGQFVPPDVAAPASSVDLRQAAPANLSATPVSGAAYESYLMWGVVIVLASSVVWLVLRRRT